MSQNLAKKISNASDLLILKTAITATTYVLEQQAHTKAKIDTVSDQPQHLILLKTDIYGKMNLCSKNFNGAMFIGFPEMTLVRIVGKLFGEPPKGVTQEALEAVGEISNMIYGQSKLVLNKAGHDFKPEFPAVFQGTSSLAAQTGFCVSFSSDAGPFKLLITMILS